MEATNKLIFAGFFLSIMLVSASVMPGVVQAQYSNCTYHAYRLCVGNNVYWYDSCGTQQDLYLSCFNGQVCNNPGQYGQCAAYYINPVLPPVNNYVPHYRTACQSGSVYWYDSLGVSSGLYKSCADSNSCTADACSKSKCSNTLKCDGSTCATGSADYNSYCATNQPIPNPAPAAASGLSISFFTKTNSTSNQWQKTTEAGSNGQVYFMISATNSSTVQIDNINVAANIPTEISSLGNLKLDGIAVAGDIVFGINIGSIAPQITKLITFEGKTQAISNSATKQATATSNVSGAAQSDSVSINFVPGQAASAVFSTAGSASGAGGYPDFWEFLKRWYLWIIAGLVLIFLFIIVFRRLSSNV